MTSIVYIQSHATTQLSILYVSEDNPELAAQHALCFIDETIATYFQRDALELLNKDNGEFTLDAVLEGKALSYSIQVNLMDNDICTLYMSWYGTIDED